MNESELIKRAKILATATAVSKKVGKKVLRKVVETSNTASSGKLKEFENKHLGLKNKGNGTFLSNKIHAKGNKAKEKARENLRKMPKDARRMHISMKTGSNSKSKAYEKLIKNRRNARLQVGTAGAIAGGLYAKKKYTEAQRRKQHQQAVAEYYQNYRGY